MQKTKIEWTDYSSNPIRFYRKGTTWVVNHACVKVSSGCANCYAEKHARRFSGFGFDYTQQTMGGLTPFVSGKELNRIASYKPRGPFKNGDRPRVFLGDMTDLFGEWVPFELLDHLFSVMAVRSDIDFQILTKRPERMLAYFTERKLQEIITEILRAEDDERAWSDAGWRDEFRSRYKIYDMWEKKKGYRSPKAPPETWPLPNVWLGTSIEDQKTADERIPLLLQCPAAVRFLSCEPLLSPIINLTRHSAHPFDWIIIGCESGPNRRPMNLQWVRDIRDQCQAAGIPLFMKQMEINGKVTADLSRFPQDLRIRNFPASDFYNFE